MKRNLLLSLLVVGVMTSLVGVASWATFSDTETSTGNTISTASLNLKMGATTTNLAGCDFTVDPFSGPLFTAAGLAPGDSAEVTVCLKNDSTMAGVINATLSVASDVEVGACTTPEAVSEFLIDGGTTCGAGNSGELTENTNILIWADFDCDNTFDPGDGEFSLFDGLASGLPVTVGPANYAAGQAACTGVLATILLAAGNEVQTDSLSIDVDATLTQAP